MYQSSVLFFAAFFLFVALRDAWADGMNDSEARTAAKSAESVSDNTVEDPRLPAVVPGQEVVRNGKTIKVWSTGGSPTVPGSRGGSAQVPNIPTTPQSIQQNGLTNSQIGVIVDGRRRDRNDDEDRGNRDNNNHGSDVHH